MNLKQLEYFVLSAEQKNITTAAKKLYMAQPPLSRQISLLEEELGVPLIKRSNRGIELTQAGEVLYRKSKNILKDIEEMTEVVQEVDSGVRGDVKIGTIYSCIPTFADKIDYISKNFPLIKFKIFQSDPHEMLEQLNNGEIDVLFLRSPTCETGNFHYQILEEDSLVLVVNKDLDPAPNEEELELEHLKDIPLCMLRSEKYWGYNEFLVNECEKKGFTPNIICECYDTSIAMVLVMKGVGLSYQPKSIVQTLEHPHIYIKPIKNFETKSYPTLIWNDSPYLSRSVRLFLSLFNAKSSQPF